MIQKKKYNFNCIVKFLYMSLPRTDLLGSKLLFLFPALASQFVAITFSCNASDTCAIGRLL